VSRTSLEEDVFISRLCKLLKPHAINTGDAKALSKKLLAQRQAGYIVAKDIMLLLDVREDYPSHKIFPDWLLQRQDFCAIQNDVMRECSVRNLRVVSAARACQVFRSPADNKCIYNWMNLNCSFLTTKNYSGKLMDFCRVVEFQEYSENSIIFEQGETTALGAYMILTGIVNIIKNGTKVGTLSADAYFGEKSLWGDAGDFRNVTVVTVVPTKMLFLAKHVFARIASNPTQYPARQDIALFLCNYCAPFRHFSLQHVLDTSRRISILSYNGLNQIILRQNERPRGLYVIRRGEVHITRSISIRALLKQLNDTLFSQSNSTSMLDDDKNNNSLVRLTVATLSRGNIIGEACLQQLNTRQNFLGYTALTASENVEIYYLDDDACLKYLLSSEFKEESEQCVADINQVAAARRILDDADLVIEYEKEIRTELMQRRNLRNLNLQPVRMEHSGELLLEKGKITQANTVVTVENHRDVLTPETTHHRVYRDKYNHRLNCLGVGLTRIPSGYLDDQRQQQNPRQRISKNIKTHLKAIRN